MSKIKNKKEFFEMWASLKKDIEETKNIELLRKMCLKYHKHIGKSVK